LRKGHAEIRTGSESLFLLRRTRARNRAAASKERCIRQERCTTSRGRFTTPRLSGKFERNTVLLSATLQQRSTAWSNASLRTKPKRSSAEGETMCRALTKRFVVECSRRGQVEQQLRPVEIASHADERARQVACTTHRIECSLRGLNQSCYLRRCRHQWQHASCHTAPAASSSSQRPSVSKPELRSCAICNTHRRVLGDPEQCVVAVVQRHREPHLRKQGPTEVSNQADHGSLNKAAC
jgi:hypothetical protein